MRLIKKHIHKALTCSIAIVWVANGLFCKVLGLVPRHRQIVSAILGPTYASPFTLLIGFLEIGMAIWIVSGYRSRLNALTQMLVIATMNTLEFTLVPHLLLWGRWNAFFAFLFIIMIYLNEFCIKPGTPKHT
ncbi:DoxX-like family protein [Filimonas lacunae]|uniref:DoxX-like family protein n=1 Tax=Filimonas lacunae TaxID=477680 RepID=A0A173MFM5_9BACT|nr:DoxX-like family protein [Filimonas lacunae]BAV06422.1 hypothetical protein FLA_2439 [Filimonas lacunae]SIT26897.1 DoxX-like family protein [Filimonas lacunae]